MKPPRKMTQDEVQAFIVQFAATAPPDVTLVDVIAIFTEQFAAMSDCLTAKQTAELLGIMGIVAKYAAAQASLANTPIKFTQETRQ